jgi:hypothetical protein
VIFHPDLAAKVLDGTKTQTRRPLKFGLDLRYPLPCRYVAGRTYAVQTGRGQKAIGRLLVLDVRSEKVVSITRADARAEGFGSPAEFWRRWVTMYGHVSGFAWVITFEASA